MKKKIMALLLATIMATSLVGCGSDAAKEEDAKQTTATTAPEKEDAKETVATDTTNNTLTVWCWDPAFNIYAMEEAAKVYKETNPDFELKVIETPWTDLQTKLTTAATSGDLSTLPDIFLMQDNAFQKNVITFPETFTNLTSSGIDFTKFGDSKIAYSTVDGANYGVPFDNGATVACYRTDVLEEAGYTLEDFTDITWTQLIEMGKDVLAKTGKPLLSGNAGSADLVMMMLQSAGSSLFDEEGNPSLVGNDTLKKAMETYVELIKTGVFLQVNDWDQYTGSFINGTVAGTINGCWIIASVQKAQDQAGNWGITNMPSLDGVGNATNYSNNGGSSWAVSANCQNTDLAFDFLSKTFAGSVPLYETILPSSGALTSYLPAADSDVYTQPQEFFGGKPVYALITEFAGKVPSNNTGVYFYEGNDAVAVALTNAVAGADITAEIKTAEDTINFSMGK